MCSWFSHFNLVKRNDVFYEPAFNKLLKIKNKVLCTRPHADEMCCVVERG